MFRSNENSNEGKAVRSLVSLSSSKINYLLLPQTISCNLLFIVTVLLATMILIAILLTFLLECFSQEKYTLSARLSRVSFDKHVVEMDEAY